MSNLSIAQLFKQLNTTEQGLTEYEAQQRLLLEKNELPAGEKSSLLDLIKEQFKDTLVIILLVSAMVSFMLSVFEGFNVEPFVILLILVLNAIVAIQQESNAEQAIEALKEYYSDESRVYRDGKLQVVQSKNLVKGDVVQLVVGDKVPADCRVLNIITSEFKADQSILTGETNSVSKQVATIKDKNAVIQDLSNMVFSGTCITVGKALCVVVNVGINTNIGKIHETISNSEEEKSPLKIQLDDFGDELAKVISIVCLLVWIININHFNDPSHGGWLKGSVYYFKIAVALAVAAIPEGLAVIITTCLALGTQQMAKEGAIVRKLKSVETLGCCSIICSDKTGTLTTNQMSVRKVYVFGEKEGEIAVDGNTYGPQGSSYFKEKEIKFGTACDGEEMKTLLEICSMCNESQVVYEHDSDTYTRIGEPTEAALFSLVEKLGTNDSTFNSLLNNNATTKDEKAARCGQVNSYYKGLFRKDNVLEFSRDRKSMSAIVTRLKSKQVFMHCKGAPESVVDRCTTIMIKGKIVPFTSKLKKAIMEKAVSWGEENAYRVLGFAFKESPLLPKKLEAAKYIEYETDMTFVGLVAMADPPRPEVKHSIEQCNQAGIRVVVITGDHQKTAESICRQIGLIQGDASGLSYTGKEFDAMNDLEKIECCNRAVVFSRTEPTHKSMLVDLYKSMGYIVAMTGDGVNDAPALKKADIGVAMGTGTDVAKMASDVVLQDDNFSTIVSSVKQGRSIYANTKQFIRYLISSNIGEVVSIFLTVVLGMPEALVPVQLLWVNLVTDGLPATALGFNPPDNDIMIQKPRNAKEKLVTRGLLLRYLVIGTYVGCATVFAYAWWYLFFPAGPQITFSQLQAFHKCGTASNLSCDLFQGFYARSAATMSLSVLVVVEMFNAMNSLSETESLLLFPLYKNMYLVFAIILSMVLHFMILYIPFLATMFNVEPIGLEEWKAVLWISAPVILVDEIMKVFAKMIKKADKVKIE